jgi:cation diffusion facilitator family transporter
MSADAARSRSLEVRRVLRLVLWMNVGVLLVKVGVWATSQAMSVMAESFHSALDAANNVFALTMARVASRGPDEDHPYGHRKFETLGALALVGVLSITVFELIQHSILRMMSGVQRATDVGPSALLVMGVALVAGVAIARYEGRVGKRLGSDLLLADAAHTRADVLTTLGVLVGLVAIHYGYPVADPIATILVALIIAHTGWQIVVETVPVLVDHRAVDPTRIETVALGIEGVLAAYQIRSRGRPGDRFAELTIAVDPTLDVATGHAIADETERRVAKALRARQVVVHVEPCE